MKKIFILIFIFSCNTPEVVKYQPIAVEEKGLILEINKERKALGLSTLIPERLLNKIAQEQVENMILKNEISHNGFMTRLEKSKAIYFSENLAYGYSTDSILFKAYINSENHKNNMFSNKPTHIGNYTKNKYNCSLFAKY